jgi:hypothetical protein
MVAAKRKTWIGLAALAAFGGWWWLSGGEAPAGLPGRREAVGQAGKALPKIDISRLDVEREPAEFGRRNLFAFGPPVTLPPTPTPVPTPIPVATPRATASGAESMAPASLNVTYIGTVEGQGSRVAVLLSDQLEVLTGREGDLVANRLRIVKIGLESVDVRDVGAESVRRLALEGR